MSPSTKPTTGLVDALLTRSSAFLEFARTTVSSAQGWRRRTLAFVAGALSVLSMAPFFFWPILFFTFPILVWLLDSAATSSLEAVKSTRQMRWGELRTAAVDGWWFGFGYFLFGLYWIGEAFLVEADIFGWLMPLVIVLMPAGLALFTAVTIAAARLFWPKGLARLFILAFVIGIGEWVRGHALTGLPWNVFGYAFTYPLSLMQTASLIGVYGMTLWVVLVCATPIVLLSDAKPNSKSFRNALLVSILIAGTPLLAMYVFGVNQLARNPTTFVSGVKLRLVQPSIPQREKWQGEKQSGIFEKHLALSRTNEQGLFDDMAGITHVIWPEASMPFLPLKNPIALQRIKELLPDQSHLIAGALRVENASASTDEIPYEDPRSAPKPDTSAKTGPGAGTKKPTEKQQTQVPARPRVFNSLMSFNASGKLEALYDKTHLVPFGEYLPFRTTFEAIGLSSLTRLRGGFEIGPTPRPLIKIPGLPLAGVLICYEVIFPGQVIATDKRPGLLINLTNDGWFGNTTGPYQHFHISRVRAVEEGLPLIRSANNGISGIIDPYGRTLSKMDLNVTGTIDNDLPAARPETLYAIWNDTLFMLNALVFLALAMFLVSHRSCKSEH